MSNEMIYGKVLHETPALALARIDLMGGDISLYIIFDKETPAVLGVGLSRRQVFANARDNAVDDEMLEKIEELELA